MEATPAKAELIQALESLLDDARAGKIGGIAATVHYSGGGFATLLSHADAWNPLIMIGGIARLERYVHTVADHSGC